jgi:hypothetical protein
LAINCCMAFLSLVSAVELDTPTTYTFWGTPFLFAACRYAGQVGNLPPIGNRRKLARLPTARRMPSCPTGKLTHRPG